MMTSSTFDDVIMLSTNQKAGTFSLAETESGRALAESTEFRVQTGDA